MTDGAWPLLEHYPALGDLPRVELRSGPTPVQSLELRGRKLWIKRDDLSAQPIGGNKVRSLEFLLGGVRAGDRVSTVGPRASTHALSTTLYAQALGAEASVALWRQEMNPIAEIVAAELRRVATIRQELVSPALALPWLWWRRARGDRTIPPGGTSALGMLGHVNAGLELAEQIRMGLLPEPGTIVIPFGTGGTVAGIALGLRIGGWQPTIVAARVVPWVIGRVGRIERLGRAVEHLIRERTGLTLPTIALSKIRVDSTEYGGGYGRTLARATVASEELHHATGIRLDGTYTAKAFATALDECQRSTTLFWHTFDSRWLTTRRLDAGVSLDPTPTQTG